MIEGAAEGAGLGIRFLKHLQRTRLLLHLVDIAPPDPEADPVKDARSIVQELKKFSADLAAKERWLVLNKLDLLPADEAEKLCKEIVRRLRWKGPVYRISGLARQGTQPLVHAIMERLEEIDREASDADFLTPSSPRTRGPGDRDSWVARVHADAEWIRAERLRAGVALSPLPREREHHGSAPLLGER